MNQLFSGLWSEKFALQFLSQYQSTLIIPSKVLWLAVHCNHSGTALYKTHVAGLKEYGCVATSVVMVTSGPWHLAQGVLSSFVSLVWCTDFQTFHRDQRISCHMIGDRTQQEAGSWALSPALMVSELSWWRYFFKLFDLIADSGPWYFQVCQGHSALWVLQKPFQLRVFADK